MAASSTETTKCTQGICVAPAQPAHTPCCSSHGRALCCAHYCRTHFVEAHPCSPVDHQTSTKES